jgi:DNA-binding MarR family transcriptional regulator
MTSPKSNNSGRFSDDGTTLKIIQAIEHNGVTSQRTLAKEVEIALGLTNAYLKRCIRKGWVKVTEAPTQRYFYYLTPKGFSEKARLTATYLSSSFDMFREARSQCDHILQYCQDHHLNRLALIGVSELAEVAILSSLNKAPDIIAVVDSSSNRPSVAGIPVARQLSELSNIDAVIITDMRSSQVTFEGMLFNMPEKKILAPELLHLNRKGTRANEKQVCG